MKKKKKTITAKASLEASMTMDLRVIHFGDDPDGLLRGLLRNASIQVTVEGEAWPVEIRLSFPD